MHQIYKTTSSLYWRHTLFFHQFLLLHAISKWYNKQVWMYYGSGTVDRSASGQLADAAAYAERCMCNHQMAALFSVKQRHGCNFLKCDINRKMQLCQMTCINFKNDHIKFHPDPIWNNGALGFSEEHRPNNNKKNKTSSDMESVPHPKKVHRPHTWGELFLKIQITWSENTTTAHRGFAVFAYCRSCTTYNNTKQYTSATKRNKATKKITHDTCTRNSTS